MAVRLLEGMCSTDLAGIAARSDEKLTSLLRSVALPGGGSILDPRLRIEEQANMIRDAWTGISDGAAIWPKGQPGLVILPRAVLLEDRL